MKVKFFEIALVKKTALVLGVVAASLSGLSSFSAQAETYTIGVENIDYLPAYGLDKGEYIGYAREVFDAFAKAKGHTFIYKPLPVPRLYASIASGDLDFKFPDNQNWAPDRREGLEYTFSGSVIDYIDGVVRPPNSLGKPIKILGTVTGFTPWVFLDKVKSGDVKVLENADFTSLVRQAMAGRIDGAYASVAVANRQLDEVIKNSGALVFDSSQAHDRNSYMLSTVNHPELIKEFDAWMAENKTFIAELKERHAVEKGIE